MKRFLAVFAGGVMAVVFNTTAFAQAGSSNNEALMLLLNQVQDIRTEMQALRGMVEEQGYEIRRLQQDSLDRYTDLDARISALYEDLETARGAGSATGAGSNASAGATPATPGASPAANAGASPSGNAAVNTSALPTAGAAPVSASTAQTGGQPVSNSQSANNQSVNNNASLPASTGMLTEQQLYELALDSLLQQEAYQRSVQEFDQYLAQYPDGRFVTNAYYWQGQAYVNLSMFNEARVAFETILEQYPDGRKIEDAMYSLGTVYHRLGDNARARQLLQDVRARFPNTSAANLADIYMRSLN
jgi:tol-pal system protein YbgF